MVGNKTADPIYVINLLTISGKTGTALIVDYQGVNFLREKYMRNSYIKTQSSVFFEYCGAVNPIGLRGFNSLFFTCNSANDSLISSSCIRVSSLISL